jgi:alkanesulfonate monooxygenase SsuD/methylene tetrahydromethanopterin reductase-like flavin-dependent oxidoreductase (luciferase family)
MTQFGYTLMTEQSGPKDLVRYASAAEDAGFDLLVSSDHYFPWLSAKATPRTRGPSSAPSRR